MGERCCKTCRHWDVRSRDEKVGDCRAPGDHRHSQHRLPDGIVALFDSFGPETTRPGFVCGAWDNGEVAA